MQAVRAPGGLLACRERRINQKEVKTTSSYGYLRRYLVLCGRFNCTKVSMGYPTPESEM